MHTRNISGLTDKCAQRMAQLLLSDGDPDACPIPGLPASSVGTGAPGAPNPMRDARSEARDFFSSNGPSTPGKPSLGGRSTTPGTTQAVRRTTGFPNGSPLGNPPSSVDHFAPASASAGLGLGMDLPAARPPVLGLSGHAAAGEPGTYLGGPPGMGGLSAGAMSPIQRSIFRGGHDATGGGHPRGLLQNPPSPISSPQIRGHTAAGGRITLGGSTPPFGSPFHSAAGGASFEPNGGGGRLPHVRTAAPSVSRSPLRSQTASVGFGRPQPGYSPVGRGPMQLGGSPIPNHMRPPSLRGAL